MTYQLIIRPLEAYFLGTERNFKYGSKTKNHQRLGSYHIESDQVPSQTTLLGVVRNLLIGEFKKDDFSYSDEEKEKIARRIGHNGFDLANPQWDFGLINSISPIMLLDEKKDLYIPTPLNHRIKNGVQKEIFYTPFTEEYVKVNTNHQEKWIPTNYNAKDGIIMNAWMSLKTGSIMDDLFTDETHVGFNIKVRTGGFFKKSYCRLKEGYAFTCFVDLDELPEDKTLLCFTNHEPVIIYMGKGKSAFSLTIRQHGEAYEKEIIDIMSAKNHVNSNQWAYALSDIFVGNEIFDYCYFASTGIHELRARTTDLSQTGSKRFKMSDKLYSFVRAGSFFIVNNRKAFEKAIASVGPAYQKIGWNTMLYGGNN